MAYMNIIDQKMHPENIFEHFHIFHHLNFWTPKLSFPWFSRQDPGWDLDFSEISPTSTGCNFFLSGPIRMSRPAFERWRSNSFISGHFQAIRDRSGHLPTPFRLVVEPFFRCDSFHHPTITPRKPPPWRKNQPKTRGGFLELTDFGQSGSVWDQFLSVFPPENDDLGIPK